MAFAELKAHYDGRNRVIDRQMDTLIKASGTSALMEMISGGPASQWGQGWAKTGKAREMYRLLRNWVYSATSVISKRCSAQPWMAGHYDDLPATSRGGRMTPKGYDRTWMPQSVIKAGYGQDIETDPEHDVLWVLDKPNFHQGKSEFIQITVMNLLLTGEFYWIGGINKAKDKKDRKLEVWAVPSAWVVPDHSKGPFAGYRLQTGMGEGAPLDPGTVARGYFPDPSDIKGCLSPLQSCISAAKIDDYILKSQEQSFERGIHPNLIVTIGKTLDAEGRQTQRRPVLAPRQRTQIIRSIQHAWNMTVNTGMPAIIDGLIEDIKKLSNTPQEMDWKQSGDIVKARIFQAFGVNPISVGEVTPANKAQAVVADKQLCDNALNPIIENISCAAAEFFTPFYEDGDSLAVWLEVAKPKDDEMEFRQMTEARKAGDVTQDEYRSYIGLKPIDPEPEPERSPLFNNPQTMAQITALAAQVTMGAIGHDEAVQICMTMLQISKADAAKMMPDDPPEPPEGMTLPGQQVEPIGGQSPAIGGPQAAPKPANGQSPKPAKPPKDEEDKGWEDQPRVPPGSPEGGQFGSGGSGGGSSADSPVSDHAAAVLDQWTTPSTGSREGEYEAIRKRGEEWVKGGKDQGFQDLYDETQARLKSAGVKEIEAFRGMDIPSNHPLAKAIADGKINVGDEFNASGMVLNSWSEDGDVATRFADNPLARAERNTGARDTIGIVVQRVVKAEDVVTGARVHTGFLNGENELVAKNTGPTKVMIVGIYKKQ